MPTLQILAGDCRETLRSLPDASVNCCVTSPPYFGLRDYGNKKQIGNEATMLLYMDNLLSVCREVYRVLRDDGTFWLNLGDSSASTWSCNRRNAVGSEACDYGSRTNRTVGAIKEKDLMGVPWRMAFALQKAGWYLRQDIIWHKPNPMPESVTDRPTRAHEYIFLLTKRPKYFYDQDAIKEPMSVSSEKRLLQDVSNQVGSTRANGGAKKNGTMKAVGKLTGAPHGRHELGEVIPPAQRRDKQRGHGRRHDGFNARWDQMERDEQCSGMRNKRSVWTVAPANYKEAHFATFPPDLIKPCILAGCPQGGVVLDPFGGSGTTGQVALELGRSAILCELNPDYIGLIRQRCSVTPGFGV
ncbi:MAG: site-specific DNA-methyltransferase [Proteobacteria bacterium]|nr:site-specific DNA-methyltransferase [Pseudomonadota bacterium]